MKKDRGSTTTRRKPSGKTGAGKNKVEFQGYVNWTLTDSHKLAFGKWLETNPDVSDLIDRVVESGYSFKVRYDDYNQCMSAGLYCTDAESPNAGWNLNMRAGDSGKAMLRLLFVHYVALDEMWATDANKGWDEDAW